MASINGISLKAVKNFKDHEGCTIAQGNLYLDGKKVGFWSQDSWGGPDQVDVPAEVRKELERRVKDYNDAFPKDNIRNKLQGTDADLLLYDLLQLIELEIGFKRAVKAGYKSVLSVTDGYHTSSYLLPDITKDWKKRYAKDIKELEKGMFPNKPKTATYITDMAYFDAKFDVNTPAYEWMVA